MDVTCIHSVSKLGADAIQWFVDNIEGISSVEAAQVLQVYLLYI